MYLANTPILAFGWLYIAPNYYAITAFIDKMDDGTITFRHFKHVILIQCTVYWPVVLLGSTVLNSFASQAWHVLDWPLVLFSLVLAFLLRG